MITELTEAQKAKMPEYVKKWIAVGTSTEDVADDSAKTVVRDFRALINLDADVPLVFADNPIESWVLCCLHEYGVKQEDLNAEMHKVFERTSTYSIPKASLPYNTCHLAYVFSFYDYMLNEVGVTLEDDLLKKYMTWQNTSALWAIYPLKDLTVVCRKPTSVKLNENNVLHCDGAPAIEFNGLGDFKVFALNGIRVPEYLAMTPSHQLDIADYTKEANADVKAEFLRKAGVERFLEMGKLVDSYTNYDQESHPWWWKSEYELWDMASLFTTVEHAYYLKMLNQTTGVWHMEAVSPKQDTLQKAIKERFHGKDLKIVHVS